MLLGGNGKIHHKLFKTKKIENFFKKFFTSASVESIETLSAFFPAPIFFQINIFHRIYLRIHMHVQYCSSFIILPLYFNVNCITSLFAMYLLAVHARAHFFHKSFGKKCNRRKKCVFCKKLNKFSWRRALLGLFASSNYCRSEQFETFL